MNTLGHCRSEIVDAVHAQFQQMDQVIFAGATHRPGQLVAKELLRIAPEGLHKVFFSDNGSTAVEVGLKMALQFWFNQGCAHKKRFVALRHSYHGDTFGAMSVSEPSPFNSPFPLAGFPVSYLDPPVAGRVTPESVCEQVTALCSQYDDIAGFIYEPMVQGAGGMHMQNPVALEKMLETFRSHGVLCIADEVMTGFGRTGKMFASMYTSVQPDIMCVAKGLSGGTFPIAATLASEKIYEVFHHEDRQKAFFHGHSFTGNPLGCAAALASMKLLQSSETLASIEMISSMNQRFLEGFRDAPGREAFKDVRACGTILACEVDTVNQPSGYFNHLRDEIESFFLDRLIFARPLGNVVYLLPPYCSEQGQIYAFYDSVVALGESLLRKKSV